MTLSGFLGLALFLILVLMLIISLPFLLKSRNKKQDEITNIMLVRGRLSEMEREFNEGLISKRDLNSAKNEVKLALIEEQKSTPLEKTASRSALIIGGVIALGISSVVYLKVNHFSEIKMMASASEQTERLSQKLLSPEKLGGLTLDDIQTLALAIRLKLNGEPEDAQGWMFLGKLRLSTGQLDEAIAAFERSLNIEASNHSVRVNYVQALMMKSSEVSMRLAQQQLRYLLSINHDDNTLNLMMAVASAELGQNTLALPFYLKIRDKLDSQSTVKANLDNQLGIANKDVGLVEIPKALTLSINLSQKVKNKVPLNGHMIVFVRPDNLTSGIPIAVKRLKVDEFPVTLTLTDDDAMLPEKVLSDFASVNVTVRLSATQNVDVKSGDIEGALVITNRVPGSTYSILIDKEIE